MDSIIQSRWIKPRVLRLPGNPPFDLPSASARSQIWPMVAMLLSTLVPAEVRVNVVGVELYPYRIAFLICLPAVLRNLGRTVDRLNAVDQLLIAAITWIMLAAYINHGIDILQRTMVDVSDMLVGYLVARTTLNSLHDLRRVLAITAPFFLLAALSVAAESISGVMIVRPFVQAIFSPLASAGNLFATPLADYSPRLGFFRGVGPFPHPILAGLQLALLIPIYTRSQIRNRLRITGILAGSLAIFTLSSTAFLAAGLGLLLLAFDRLVRIFSFVSWGALICAFLITLIGLQLFTDIGIVGAITRLSLDPQTALFRQLIFEYGSISVSNNPLFGIGYNDYSRPSWMLTASVDNYWLLISIRFGIFATVATFAASAIAAFALTRSVRNASIDDGGFMKGIAMALVIAIISGAFVAFFQQTQIFFFLVVGSAVNIAAFEIQRKSGFDHVEI